MYFLSPSFPPPPFLPNLNILIQFVLLYCTHRRNKITSNISIYMCYVCISTSFFLQFCIYLSLSQKY